MKIRFLLSAPLLSLAVFFSFALKENALAADANFYTLKDQWVSENKPKKNNKEKALEDGFQKAFENRIEREESIGTPVPAAIRRALSEIISSQTTVELESGQTLFIENVGGLTKFIPTDEGIVLLENVDSETLKVTGSDIGTTYVHIWNSKGRSTVPIRVIPPKVVLSHLQIRQREAIEKNRSFRFNYDNSRSASYNGVKFRDMPRSSSDFNQNFKLEGDTPYGDLSGNMQLQKAGGKTLLSEARIRLEDGKIGRFDKFNAAVGDSQVSPNLMIFPTAKVRGGLLEHWDEQKKLQWATFYGRENSSLFGTISPGLLSERTKSSFLSGTYADYRVNDNAKVKGGVFTGSGRSRQDELNRAGYGGQAELKLGPNVTMNNETDFDDEKFVNKHSFTTKFEKIRIKNEFRDISKKFFTMVGPPSRQGEVGYLLDVSANPSDRWAYNGSFDIFRDRLIPNPTDPDAVNLHTDMALNYFPCDEVNMTFNFQNMDDTGRIGPSRYRTLGAQYNERFDFWGKKATMFTRYNYRTNELLTSSLSNYRQNQVTLGFYTSLFWGINFSAQKEWNALEEPEISRYTHPNALVYTLDTSRQLWDTPFFMEARFRIRDEEQTESTNSFMAGEDSAEVSGGVYYREFEDLELFLTGSLTQYVAENASLPSQRVEAQFYTGMRWGFDTGLRWSSVGSFEGYVYKDVNGDGVRQPNEPGLPNMTVLSSDGKQALVDQNGYYQIKSVAGKKVTLALENSKIPYGFVPTGSLNQEFDIQQGKTQQADFGLTPRSDLTGVIFNDLNGNEKYENNEPGISTVKLMLENGQSVWSNASGVYTFSNLVAGDHTISLVVTSLPEGYLPSQTPKKNFTLFEGVRYELSFPLRPKRMVTGRVFSDKNGNRVMDADETPLAAIPVLLGAQKVITDKDGWYLFDDLKPGSNELLVDLSAQLDKFEAPTPIRVEMSVEPSTLSDMNIPVTPKKIAQEQPQELKKEEPAQETEKASNETQEAKSKNSLESQPEEGSEEQIQEEAQGETEDQSDDTGNVNKGS